MTTSTTHQQQAHEQRGARGLGDTRRRARGLRGARVLTAATAIGITALAALPTTPAHAGEWSGAPHHGHLMYPGDDREMWVGTVSMASGARSAAGPAQAVCVEPGKHSPWEHGGASYELGAPETDFVDQRGERIGAADTAALAHLITTWGPTTDTNTAIGVQMAAWLITDHTMNGAEALGDDFVRQAHELVRASREAAIVSAQAGITITPSSRQRATVGTSVALTHADGSQQQLEGGRADGVLTITGARFVDGGTSRAVHNGESLEIVPDTSDSLSQHITAIVDYGEEDLGTAIRLMHPDRAEFQRMLTVAPAPIALRGQAELDAPTDAAHGSVSWAKHDVESGAAIAGSAWTLTPLPPTVGEALRVVDNGVLDADRAAGQLRVDRLELGEYELRETAPPAGYALGGEPVRVHVARGASTVRLDPVDNARIPGRVSWRKTVKGGHELLAGTSWRLDGPNGAVLEIADGGPRDEDATAGAFSVTGLAWGAWRLSEVAAPLGYTPARGAFAFDLGPSETAIDLGEIANERILGRVRFTKVDAQTGAALDGSEWVVRRVPGADRAIEVTPSTKPTPDTPAMSAAPRPTLGQPERPERGIPPVPLPRPSLLAEDTHDASGELVLGSAVSREAGDSVIDDGHSASAAEFSIIDGGTLDLAQEPGVLALGDLPWGAYELVEVRAPEGYELMERPVPFIIDGEHLAPDLGEIGDVRSPSIAPQTADALPQTGAADALPVLFGGGVMLLLGVGVLAAARSRRAATLRSRKG